MSVCRCDGGSAFEAQIGVALSLRNEALAIRIAAVGSLAMAPRPLIVALWWTTAILFAHHSIFETLTICCVACTCVAARLHVKKIKNKKGDKRNEGGEKPNQKNLFLPQQNPTSKASFFFPFFFARSLLLRELEFSFGNAL